MEDEDGAVFAGNLDRVGGFGTLVEQIEALLHIVVWDPFANGLPRWLDGLEGFDVEGRVGRWWDVDDSFPKSVEAEEELDFAAADDGADALHGGLAARALEEVGAPDAEAEVAPKSGRMARAVTLGGGGTMGGFGAGCSSAAGFSCGGRRGMPRLLFE